jgi:hypothetical protein
MKVSDFVLAFVFTLLPVFAANCFLIDVPLSCNSIMMDVGVFASGTQVPTGKVFSRANVTVVRIAIVGNALSDIMQFCCVRNGIQLCDQITAPCSGYMNYDPDITYGVYIPSSVTEYWVIPKGACSTSGIMQRHLILEQCKQLVV